ncbi:MAG: transcription antitermination protein NusB [Cyanobacteria bacterium]|nr:transcription antitermination protein NusB [Cyanobacteria bacterium CG_2015-16_32_12]NCO79234.1 transcription antitermination protein NusB [Cyanobacteria bacterium CG_2015-22_32_23]NCQ04484.1 transcription antitermination protein NusB [Cyanobacteria bacterium CG_2015-09_32_10]NCQ41293.1 transcription antitermination protein NusB [Cyanobacteria bacterium CG_2015-04_32_10]NCS84394.1 transcription antitermination protein NusB [Cyanobacteria bacterium CG_2015-02_32_10]
MSIRQQPRRTARILSLLTLSQFRAKSEQLEDIEINDLILGAIRTLTVEIESTIETASDELNRSNDKLFKSDTRATDLGSAKTMLKDAITLTQKAINRLGSVIEIPEFVQLSRHHEVREYAVELIGTVDRRRIEIEAILNEVMVDWTLNRLTQIDANILRLAVAEMAFLNVDHKVAINEAIEVAKNYSDDDGFRFINGVLRKVSDKLTKMLKN